MYRFTLRRRVLLPGKVVLDQPLQAIIRINLTNSNRTIISNAATGTGTNFVAPVAIALDHNGQFVVIDRFLAAVFRADSVTGNRTIVSNATTGTGSPLTIPVPSLLTMPGNCW